MKAIRGALVYYRGKLEKDLLVIYDKKIQDIVCEKDFDRNMVDEIIEVDGDYLLPGFIDLHIHGYGGSDVMDASPQALETISKGVLKNGVTSFLATTMTRSRGDIEKAIENIGSMMKRNLDGARILGAHMEGPFIDQAQKGAQAGEHIIPVDEDLFLKYKDTIKIITMAPEIQGALQVIEKYKEDFHFSLGHTSADYARSSLAIDKGARAVTHLFNAMTGLGHREPGLVGAALTKDCYTELICDNFHVDSSVYQIVLDSKGEDKILLITDSIRAGGLKDGKYDLGGQEVSVNGIRCMLKDGTIAGSVLRFNEAIRNFFQATDTSLEGVFKMSAKNQAQYLGIDHKLGSIEKGKLADLVVLDGDFEPVYTIVDGKVLYKK